MVFAFLDEREKEFQKKKKEEKKSKWMVLEKRQWPI